MKYLLLPRSIKNVDVLSTGFSWSPSNYRRVEIPTSKTCLMRDLLADWCNGEEVGSLAYVQNSPYRFIRTKAIQAGNMLSQFKGDAVGYITPWAYHNAIDKNPGRIVQDGDIIYARGGNVGEVAIAENCGRAIPSGHVIKISLREKKWYVFAFMKHAICKLQQRTPQAGAIKALDNFKIEHLLACKVPFPDQPDAERVEKYIAAITEAIVDKERAIRNRHASALAIIASELNNGLTEPYKFVYPTQQMMASAGRIDAGFWSAPLQESLHRLSKYERGAWSSIYDAGFTTRRGPNLAVSVSGPAQYSDKPFGAALPLATPGDISDFMTLPKFRYYGNRRRVDTVRHGEILFAAKGVREVSIGHTWVNLGNTPFVTNFDSFLIHSPTSARAICLAFLLSYLKSTRVFAKLSDTSNGGSFVQSHWHALPIPKFRDDFVQNISEFYHSSKTADANPLSISGFVAYHRTRNATLGIWQLDADMKALHAELAAVQELIIQGKSVKVPLTD